MTRPDLFAGEPAPREPQQARSRGRRERVVRSAMERFAADGYERASIRAIAGRAGVASGAVYQFFRSKRELLLAAMDALLSHLESFSPPSMGNPRTLPADLERFLTDVFAREAPFVGVYRAWREASLVDETIARLDRIIHVWTSARILGLFTRLAALPGARAGLDLAVLAELWDRFFWDLLATPPSDSRRAARSIARTLSHTFQEDAAGRARGASGRRRTRR
jgi:AcrR family transcriptional regulator